MSEIVTLVSPLNQKTTCQIDPTGCGLGEVWLNGIKVLWTGVRPDGGKGFTHPCLPNFNLAEGLPNHGPARKAEWLQEDEQTWSWRMAEIPGIYPEGLEATRVFELGEASLTVTTTVTNQGTEPLAINVAEHHYFACPPTKRAKVKVDGHLFSPSGLKGEAEFKTWSEGEHLLEIPETGTIKLAVQGYQAFAQWSQPGAEFICVEPLQVLPPAPAKFLQTAPKLLPGESKIFSYTLSQV